MLWYEYRQSNPGGYYRGKLMNIFIQATNSDVANALAERLGVYFNGTRNGTDCSCCGDRWYYPYCGEEEKPEPYSFDIKEADGEKMIVAAYVYDNGKTCDFIGVPMGISTQEISQSLLT